MSKKLQDLKWESVALEGFPASLKDNFQGFVGLEECTSYGLDKESKKPKKKKPEKKRKNAATEEKNVPNKKVKLSNGFIVETFDSIAPSLTNEENKNKKEKSNKNKRENNKKHKREKSKKSKVPERIVTENKKKKAKLGDNVLDTPSLLTPEDMLTWAEFKLPETILKALAECGFKKPTNIQQLVLPAAIHGRRDILGAAETGSGKTLAFGLPILSGILKLKEKAAAGLDVYELPYKKTSAKKKAISEPTTDNKKKGNKNNKKQKTVVKKFEQKNKESSEDGYSSGEESNNEETDNENEESNSEIDEIDSENEETDNENEETDSENDQSDNDNEETQSGDEETETEENASNDNIEEIDVPLKKKEISADEGHDTDDSENYIHLSEMLDSDDLADSNDDGKDEETVDNDEKSKEMDEEEVGEVDENQEGIGCVKVIDDIEMPGQVVTKTGKPLYALILTPTRELAIQISRHLMAAAKYTGIRIATIVGGMAAVKQERVLRCGPEVVVATPGRLWELLNQGQPHLQQIDCIKFLAIDETDRMIERGHFEELTPLLERLNADEARRSSRQNFVFSATLTMVHDLPNHLRGKKVTKRGKILNRKVEKMTPQQKIKRLVDLIGMTEPKVVDITAQNLGTAETLTESRIACSLEHKDSYLYYILKRHPGRTIVFCNSIGSVKRLAQLFTLLRCHPLPLHASMPQRQRLKNLERFRDDPHGVLVATDVAARGLDIPNVDHVIHYQVPRTAENYVHRSGRTARATKEGLTILMMEPSEAYLYSKLCRTLNKTAEIPTFPVAAQCLASIRDLVSFARDIDALELKKRRSAQALGWREKVAREMDIIVDDDNVPVKEADPGIEKALQVKRRQLNAMLSRPLIPRGFSFKYPTLNDPGALTWSHDDALQVMKKAIETGEVKKEKRKSKNAPLLKLSKVFNKKK